MIQHSSFCWLITFLILIATVHANAQVVEFSQPHGLYETPFTLIMTCDSSTELGIDIRYTTDGTVPTAQSKKFTSPLSIKNTTLVRATCYLGDIPLGDVVTASYLFIDDILSMPDVPEGLPSTWGQFIQTSGTAPADYGMDQELLEDADYKTSTIEGLKAIPSLSIVMDMDHLFSHENDTADGGIYIYTGPPVGDGTGRNWQRPISMELFGTAVYDLTVNCGVKIHGGHSRLSEKTPKHSFRLMFKEKYGPKKLKYRIFGESGPKKFDQLVLRCMYGYTWLHMYSSNRKRGQYERDMWARCMQERMGHPCARGQYVNLFLNGMYWGLYNIAERVNGYYCASNFGGNEEDYDVIKVEEDHSGHTIEASDGTLDKWKEMMALTSRAATSDEAYFQLIGCDAEGNPSDEVETLLDVDNFIDFMMLNQYMGNGDWDHHNWLAFRNRETPNQGFRFICWDSEIVMESRSTNILNLDNSGCPSHAFQKLMQNDHFRQRYAEHAYRHLVADGGLLTPEKTAAVWDSLYQIIQYPMYAESVRWGDYRRDVHRYADNCNEVYTVDNQFKTERNRMTTQYFPDRTDKFLGLVINQGWYNPTAIAQTTTDNNYSPCEDNSYLGQKAHSLHSLLIYDLTGRPINNTANYHGIAIIGGRKVMIKR